MVGAFPDVFDSSMLASFKSCPELFRKQYIEHWRPKFQSVHLHAGKAFATGIEVAREWFYVKGVAADIAVAAGLKALMESYGDFQAPDDSPKTLARMMGAYEFYFANYPLNNTDYVPITLPSGKRGIEFSFANPLPINHPVTGDPIIYCGRLDALVQLSATSPAVYMLDEKTTTALGASWARQWDLRAQFTGYAWGCREAGIRVDGAIVRGVSILKTKYDTVQAPTYRFQWQIDRWLDQVCVWIDMAAHAWRTGRWLYNLDHECAAFGGCQFREACMSQDEAPWLETAFERRMWNPLTRQETLL
jgi:hypothetical protein